MTILTDTIGGASAAGVTVDGAGLARHRRCTDTIVEQTTRVNGVDVDGVLLKGTAALRPPD